MHILKYGKNSSHLMVVLKLIIIRFEMISITAKEKPLICYIFWHVVSKGLYAIMQREGLTNPLIKEETGHLHKP